MTSSIKKILMRSYLEQQKKKSEYEDYYRQKVEEDNPVAAEQMDTLFSDAAQRLSDHPKMGKEGWWLDQVTSND